MPLIEADSMNLSSGSREDNPQAKLNLINKGIRAYEKTLKTQGWLSSKDNEAYQKLRNEQRQTEEKIYRQQTGITNGPVDPRSPARKAQDLEDERIAVEKTRVGTLPFTMARIDEKVRLNPRDRQTVKDYFAQVLKEKGSIPRDVRLNILAQLKTPRGIEFIRYQNFNAQSSQRPNGASQQSTKGKKRGVWFQDKQFNFDPFQGLIFNQKAFENAISRGTSTVLNLDGTQTPIDKAMRTVMERTGLTAIRHVGGAKERSQDQIDWDDSTGNGKAGAGKSYGFNEGQLHDMVPRGLDQWRLYEKTYFKDGLPRTDSSHHREFANNTKRDLKAFLTENRIPGFAADMVADTLLLPLEIAAEAHTFSDARESGEVRARAAGNALIGLLSTAAGGKLASAALRPISARLAIAAAPLKEGAKDALKRFSYSLYNKKDEAIRIMHEELKVPLGEARKLVEGYRQKIKSLWEQVQRKETQKAKGATHVDPSVKYSRKVTSSDKSIKPKIGETPESGLGKDHLLSEMKNEAGRGKDNAFHDPLSASINSANSLESPIYKVTNSIVNNIPENYLRDLKIQFKDYVLNKKDLVHGLHHEIPGSNNPLTDRRISLIQIARNFRHNPDRYEVTRTIIHEITHEFERQLHPKELLTLHTRFAKKHGLSPNPENWSYKQKHDFSEWFADGMENHFNRRILPDEIRAHSKVASDKIFASYSSAYHRFSSAVTLSILNPDKREIVRLANKMQGR